MHFETVSTNKYRSTMLNLESGTATGSDRSDYSDSACVTHLSVISPLTVSNALQHNAFFCLPNADSLT